MAAEANGRGIELPCDGYGGAMTKKLPLVLLVGPHLGAVSGVSTHLNLLFASSLAREFRLRHFQVGSEGRSESTVGRFARLIASPLVLAATILVERVDIVHLNTSLNRRAYWRDLIYMAVARITGTRVLYQVHGGDLPLKFSRHNHILGALLRFTLGLPEMIVVLAQCELEAYQNFIQGDCVTVLPNAIDCTPYAKSGWVARGNRVPLRLLYIGRLAREKGLYEALSGLKLARMAGVEAHFVIAGSGPDEINLRQFVDELGLTAEVSFAGSVFGKAKMTLLGETDVLLLPTYAEGLPYALLECMAAGIPAITTRVGAIPDVVVEGLHGLFVPPRNANAIGRAITQVAGNPALLAHMSVACRKRVAGRYSIERLAEDFARLYSQVGAARRTKVLTRL